MIKLTFYTKNKQVTVDFGDLHNESYENVPTVQVRDGYYEVMERIDSNTVSVGYTTIPVLRVPISQTIMFIQN
jgi:hypothetical protein